MYIVLHFTRRNSRLTYQQLAYGSHTHFRNPLMLVGGDTGNEVTESLQFLKVARTEVAGCSVHQLYENG